MKPTLTVYHVEGPPWHELKVPNYEYVFENTEDGRKALNKTIKKFKKIKFVQLTETFALTRDDLDYLHDIYSRYLELADKYYSKGLFTQKILDEHRTFFNDLTEVLND